MPEQRTVKAVCKADGDTKTVTIKINTNNLVVCDEWRKCQHHGGSHCEELGLHEDILLAIAGKKGVWKGLDHLMKESKETMMRRLRRGLNEV